jgi:LacI family transcriptional regulator
MPERVSKAGVNSIDVAKLAGVSQSAVSRVFTPGASVSKAMRDRVMQAAATLGYQPNRLAGSLITHRSHLIGVAIAFLGNDFYPVAVERLVRRLRDAGYHTMMFFDREHANSADETVEAFLQYRVDGVILASVALSPRWVTACERAGVPVVLFNRSQHDPYLSSVSVDNLAGGQTVARFLASGGHRRVAYLAGLEHLSTQRDRENGFRQGLMAEGLALFDRAVGNYNLEEARHAARALFDRPADERPDAVFVASDHMAMGVMDVLRFELGLRIPHDVSVVGFDDVPHASAPSYRLTTLQQPVDRVVEDAVVQLLERIEQPALPPRQTLVPVALVLRDSARIPENWPT